MQERADGNGVRWKGNEWRKGLKEDELQKEAGEGYTLDILQMVLNDKKSFVYCSCYHFNGGNYEVLLAHASSLQ